MYEIREFKFVTTLVLMFKKIESDDKTKLSTVYSNLKTEAIINESNIYDIFNQFILRLHQTSKNLLEEVLGWIIDSVRDHNTNISKYSPLASSSYIKLPKELNHQEKGLISIQKIEKYFRRCLVNFLYPPDHHTARIKKIDKIFWDELD